MGSSYLIHSQGVQDVPLREDNLVTGKMFHLDSPEDAPPPGKIYNSCVFVLYGGFEVNYSEAVAFLGCTIVKMLERTLAEQLAFAEDSK